MTTTVDAPEPVGRSGYPLGDDLRETMASALGLDVDEGWLAISLTLMEQATTGSAGPRTWSMPPEPGPEVTAVRADQELYGLTVWRRYGSGWVLRRGDGAMVCHTFWQRLLERFGPVTDATGEA